MLRADATGCIIEVNLLSAPDICGADTEPHGSGVNPVKIHEAFERGFQRGRIVIAERFGTARREQVGRWHPRSEASSAIFCYGAGKQLPNIGCCGEDDD